jgi:hypothetical protein
MERDLLVGVGFGLGSVGVIAYLWYKFTYIKEEEDGDEP